MKILFDLSALQPEYLAKYHGGAEYAKTVLSHLLCVRGEETIAGVFNPRRFFDPTLKRDLQDADVQLVEVQGNQQLQSLVLERGYDRFYSAMPYQYFDVDFSPVEVMFTIHGLRGIEMPVDKYEFVYSDKLIHWAKYLYKQLNRRRYVESIRSRFDKLLSVPARRMTIIAVSNHTKYSLLSNFPQLRAEDIYVRYSPRTRPLSNFGKNAVVGDLSKFDVKSRGYLLLVSCNRWVKNAFRAIKALDKIFSKNPDLDKTVLALGYRDPSFDRHIKNRGRFRFYDYVDEADLEALYREAYAFIYPTLNEGFGYPPLECLKYGTPVICSAISSLPEVYGDAVLYFNPFSVEEIENRILQILFDSDLWQYYSLRGRQRSEFMAIKQDQMLESLVNLILS